MYEIYPDFGALLDLELVYHGHCRSEDFLQAVPVALGTFHAVRQDSPVLPNRQPSLT